MIYISWVEIICLRDWEKENNKNALECFEKAIEIDPGFALAYTGKAMAYFYNPFPDSLTNQEADAVGKEMARTALTLDENLAEAHAAFARLTMYLDWD